MTKLFALIAAAVAFATPSLAQDSNAAAQTLLQQEQNGLTAAGQTHLTSLVTPVERSAMIYNAAWLDAQKVATGGAASGLSKAIDR